MDVALLLAVLEEIIRFAKFDREIVKQLFGTNYIFDNFKLNQITKDTQKPQTSSKK